MPTYTIRNKNTEVISEIFCAYTELEKILKNDTDLVQVLSAPALVGDHVVKRMDAVSYTHLTLPTILRV